MNRIISFALILSLFLVAFVLPHAKTITGKISDAKGKPIPYVTVTVKETKTAVVSDVNGNFKITVAD
ncbi:MAG: carboxypeptidase-like regulatory domain-containing protein, partial [Parafilimonas sp.]